MSTLRPMPALLFFVLAFGISSLFTNVHQGALAMSPTAPPAAAPSSYPPGGNSTTDPTPPAAAPTWTPTSGSSGGLPGNLLQAHATFYGDETASETMGGACGFGNLLNTGYGTDTAALSTTLFHNGFSCGQCYQIQCTNSPHCLPGSPTVTITATNICPPNWAQDSNNGGWCNPPRDHFDMAKPAFMKIADWHAGIVPVNYKRVPCQKTGGIRFMFQGNDYWLLVYAINVAGSGDISSMSVKGANTEWIPMSHNWGASYQAFAALGGQPLSFQVTSYTTKQTMTFDDVAPNNWSPGLTYEANTNFQL